MMILGRVMTSSGQPVSDVRVIYAIKQGPVNWSVMREHYDTGADGTFQECSGSLSANSIVRITVQRRGLADVNTTVTLPSKLTIVPIRVPAAP